MKHDDTGAGIPSGFWYRESIGQDGDGCGEDGGGGAWGGYGCGSGEGPGFTGLGGGDDGGSDGNRGNPGWFGVPPEVAQ